MTFSTKIALACTTAMLGTAAAAETMTIGIEQFRTRRDLWLDRMLVQPLRGPASGYPINREEGDER